MDVNVMIGSALSLMVKGMGTVFFVLLIFYTVVQILMKLFPEK